MFKDLFGNDVEWFDPKDGWDPLMRESLKVINKVNQDQPKLVPAFTDVGYVKTKIPKRLHDFILEQRDVNDFLPERALPSAYQVNKKNE